MGNDVQLLSLRLFIRVAHSGSFTEAAYDFDLPPSSVSRRISALEQALGQRLLYRHSRAVRLTEAGERYLSQVSEALALLDMATDEVSGTASVPRGILRINAPVAYGRKHIAPLLEAFQSRYPELEIELTLTDAFVDPVQEGADVVVRIGALEDSSLVARELSWQRFVIAASPGYLARHGVPTQPEDLGHHNCLVYKGTRGKQPWYVRREDHESFQAIEVHGNLRSNNAESLIEAAISDQGVVLFPTWLLQDALNDGGLVPVLEDWQAANQPRIDGIHLIFPENRLRSPKVGAFVDYLFAQHSNG
ncbi:LysR family transcriptional regulator [Halomonas binhaiensis]|uniref:LysR family transcriptional regulator n=1 Tax=Halomonas binhaiensis TaxID=2562282 RepID=A0A5C1ND73_9GAMM|nr:LysR family transcriptional regulator [Halomonas binhaiensis]QEM80921.1 LysR family transcriptional regulator [Halomonas binhaiensis]